MRRSYAGAAAKTTLSVVMDTVTLSMTVLSFTGWPSGSGGPFVATIDRGTANEEKVLIESITGTVATLAQRGYDGTTAHSHAVTAEVEHTSSAVDHDEANAHVNATGSVHGVGPTEGAIVATDKVQTLKNKTIDGDDNTFVDIPRTASPQLQADIAAETAARIAADDLRYTKAEVDALLASGVPIGTIIMHGGATAPSGFLSCNGAAVSRTTYAALFAAIGTTHGVGDGSTTFNLPNLAAKAPKGAGGGYTAGQSGGAESSVIATTHLPPHSHTLAHTHDITHDHANATTSSDGTHSHGATYKAGAAGSDDSWVRTHGSTGTVGGTVGAPAGAHSHTVDIPGVSGSSGGASTASTGNGPGSSTALPTLDPFTVVLFCIKV